MQLKRYKITGRGSLTQWEKPDGTPSPRGRTPDADCILVRHTAKENSDVILDAEFANDARNVHFKLVPILERGTITVDTAAGETVEKAVKESAPKAAKAPKQSADASVTTKLE